jgi:suppressor for copper-sensitivity B
MIVRYILLVLFLVNNSSIFVNANDFSIEKEKNQVIFSIDLDEQSKIFSHISTNGSFPFSITIDGSKNLKNYKIIWPQSQEEVIFGQLYQIFKGSTEIKIEVIPENLNKPIILRGNLEYVLCDGMCKKIKQDFEVPISLESDKHEMSWIILFWAFLGGVILNFMPCILPVLTLKIFHILNNNQKQYKLNLLFTIAGILLSFIVLGAVTIAMKALGVNFGLGTNFQSPRFIMILIILMLLFASSILYETKIRVFRNFHFSFFNYKFKNQYVESFMAGVISSIFATPCTAPFLGSAMAFALTASSVHIMVIFVLIGLGLSLPQILLLAFPKVLQYFPKPGPWMESFKRILAVSMLAVVMWLLHILYLHLGFIALLAYAMLLSVMKFIIIESDYSKIKKYILSFIVLLVILYVPLDIKHDEELIVHKIDNIWEEFNEESLNQYIKKGKIVIVNITADWCMTCKYNKYKLWNSARFINFASSQDNIVFLRGDITKPSDEIHKFLVKNNAHSIPFDIIYGPKDLDGVILPTLVTFDDIVNSVKKVQ